MNIVSFKAEHLKQLSLQQAQAYLSDWVTPEQGAALENYPSYTAVVNGIPICSAGIIPQWQGRALAWAFIADTGPQQFIGIHKAIKRFLDDCYIQRVEMTVDCDFPAGHRWAKMLGFKKEADCMKAYSPDGRDCALYARILGGV